MDAQQTLNRQRIEPDAAQRDVPVPGVLHAVHGHHDGFLHRRGERQDGAVEEVVAHRLARLGGEDRERQGQQEGDEDRLAVAS